MTFEPIAIVGQGCVLPGCLDPAALWATIAAGKVQVTAPPPNHWRVDMRRALSATPDERHPDASWSDRGGYVTGFNAAFRPNRYTLDEAMLRALDPVFLWSLYAARQALDGVAHQDDAVRSTAGVILGNLSYPTSSYTRLAEQIWLEQAGVSPAEQVHPLNRFMSGRPASLTAEALGLGGFSTALDAACASGLYAIKVACDRLQHREADLMLAGAVNGSDPSFIHVGFCALNALSHSGRSRPFHAAADGLVPAEGAAFVALKRLDDALAQGDTIHGIVRGIGLSNDGRTGGFLTPSTEGQVRSMEAAYAAAGCEPHDIPLVECHATGTAVGDATEIRSMATVFGAEARPVIGSLKANLGHSITVSGVAGLMKVLGAFEAESLPATPIDGDLHPEIEASGFPVLRQAHPWPASGRPRLAAVSSFGFGGNNAHLIVEESPSLATPTRVAITSPFNPAMPLAVVGLGVRTHLSQSTRHFVRWLKGETSDEAAQTSTVRFSVQHLTFPPNDLRQTLGQQLLMLAVSEEALADVHTLAPSQTGVFIGMGADPEVCRYGLRFRLPDYLDQLSELGATASMGSHLDEVVAPLQPAGVIGMMPNIPANRLNNHFQFEGMGFTVANEELSGDTALRLAASALRRGEIKAALVGAVDFCRHPVHEQAARATLDKRLHTPADASVALVLKPLTDARRDGDTVMAVLDPSADADRSAPASHAFGEALTARLGHAHAASGLLCLAAAILTEAGRFLPETPSAAARPRARGRSDRTITVTNTSFTGARMETTCVVPSSGAETNADAPVRLFVMAANSPVDLTRALETGSSAREGVSRLAFVCAEDERAVYTERALRLLKEKPLDKPWAAGRIVYHPAPVTGELAFVYAGAASVYPGMGRALLLHHSECLDRIPLRDPRRILDWIYDEEDRTLDDSPFAQLCGSSLLCQVHTAFTHHLLGIHPDASLGLSSGETNAMFALGVWQEDMHRLLDDIEAGGMYTEACAGPFRAVQTHWNQREPVAWENWLVLAPADAVRKALAPEDRVYLTIIQTPNACVIGGDAVGCRRVIEQVGTERAQPLNHPMAVHCPAILPYEPVWRAIHTRPVSQQPRIRFYSNFFGSAYTPTQETVADALTGQALRTVDFPSIVRTAWDDGVRIFVEHGPRNALSQSIREILGGRPHLAVSLDVGGTSSLVQAYLAAAHLWCAGIEMNIDTLAPAAAEAPQAPTLDFSLYLPPLCLALRPTDAPRKENTVPPPVSDPAAEPGVRFLPPPPGLAPAGATDAYPAPTNGSVPQVELLQAFIPDSTLIRHDGTSQTQDVPARTRPSTAADALARAYAGLAEGHQHFVQQLARSQLAYTDLLDRVRRSLTQSGPISTAPLPAQATSPPPNEDRTQPIAETHLIEPKTPLFDRRALEVHASGQISSIFGPLFEQQDIHAVQVRMPEPPLLLCDRVIRIEGEPGSMGLGTVWTETDIRADSWHLHNGRIPAGLFIEAGQADLFLISWLGIDFHNKGERAYRLLGCELTFHGSLPQIGDTLEYEIHVDGHAVQGDVRLFFFHYECHVRGERRISVRNGQAGFFTPDELAQSAGVLWDPETADYTPEPRLSAPPVQPVRDHFTESEVTAYTEGDLVACFGETHRWTCTHTRTPRSQSGPMNLIGQVTRFDPRGGPAGRGYLQARTRVQPDDWFFDGHFKNDPCMPGTLMAEATLQAMAFYLTALGFTLERDGWRFEPLTDTPYSFVCRGQVTPESQELVYEVFVDELVDEPFPVLYAHVLCTVDGLKAFLCERLALRLLPDGPLTSRPELLQPTHDGRPVARLDGFPFDHASLLNCAWGSAEKAFGPLYRVHNPAQRIPRLPGPPYHFMTRILQVKGTFGGLAEGAEVEVAFDFPPHAWFFQEQGGAMMPFCVLLEAALQPCGWLSSYMLDEEGRNTELFFRNLDGAGVVHRPVRPDDASLTTRVRNTTLAKIGSQIIVKFDVACRVGDETVYTLDTAFGFFPAEVMADQKGLSPDEVEIAQFTQEENLRIELTDRPAAYFEGPGPRLPSGRLLMIDRITGLWPDGGRHKAGLIRAEKDVEIRDWFFKAHFFQDPVQPGSLGLEAMLQVLQWYLLHEHPNLCGPDDVFEPLLCGADIEWHYRGQITPHNRKIGIDVEIKEVGRNEKGPYVLGEARLWGDGKKIYHAPQIGVQILAEGRRATAGDDLLLPDASRIEVDPVSGRCLNLPFNRWIVRDPEPDVAPLNWQALRERWGMLTGVPDSFIHDVTAALMRRFIRWIQLDAPADVPRLAGRPVLFLANHQTGIESLLFLGAATALYQLPVQALAKQEHQHTWVAQFHQLADQFLGDKNPSSLLLLNRSDLTHMLHLMQAYAVQHPSNPASLLVHVEGTRSQACGRPVEGLSAVLIDLAIEKDLPIVPVRFYGGLPRKPVAKKLEFPWQFGRQDIYIGAAIDPAQLRTLPNLERKAVVLDALRDLGPAYEQEQPLPGDPAFAERVSARHGMVATPTGAVLLEALLQLPDPSAETRAFLAALVASTAPGGASFPEALAPIKPLFVA